MTATRLRQPGEADPSSWSLWLTLLLCGLGGWAGARYPWVNRQPNSFGPPFLAWCGLIIGVAGLVAVIVKAIRERAKQQKSTWFQDIFCWFLIGLVGIPGLGLFLNGFLDFSPPETHITTVIEQFHTEARRGANHYVRVRDWRDARQTVRFSLNREQAEQIARGGPRLRLVTRRGFLGYEWRQSMEPLP